MKKGDLVIAKQGCPHRYDSYVFEVIDPTRSAATLVGPVRLTPAAMIRVICCGPMCETVMGARNGEILVIAHEYLEVLA